jgi:anthranilate synthase component 1
MKSTNEKYDLSWIPEHAQCVHIADDIDFHQLYNGIRTEHDYSYLFESLSLPRHQDRYHTSSFDPAIVFTGKGDQLLVSGKEKYLKRFFEGEIDQAISCENPYRLLQSIFPYRVGEDIHHGGLIGFASHESVNYFEPSLNLEEHPDFPPFEFALFLDGLVFDTTTGTLTYYTYDEDRSDYVKSALSRYKTYEVPSKLGPSKFIGHSETRQEFESYVEATRSKIIEGYSFQAEVGFKSRYKIEGDKIAIYNRLRQVNPSPYMYYLAFANRTLLGASPEILISMRNGRVVTTPTAGTTGRSDDELEDRKLARELLNDPKEIAEHYMLVDLHRNDIARVCKPGTVKVDDLMYIIKFSHVQHIVSNIIGEISAGKDSFDVLSTILPGGVVTGAPKIETLKIIEENEKQPRGPYGGAVGRFSFNGDCDFCLPIRSIFCIGDDCFAQTSAGVVYDSIPENEFKEVLAKLAAMSQTLRELGVSYDD